MENEQFEVVVADIAETVAKIAVAARQGRKAVVILKHGKAAGVAKGGK